MGIWAIVSVVMMIILSFLSFISQRVILAGIDADKEVIFENNIALGVMQCAIYISLGLLLSELMA